MNSFEPELGQLLFSNSDIEEQEAPYYVQQGIDLLGDAISKGDFSKNPTNNSGSGTYENDVFVMRSFCWCDGDRPGHEESCPPNFELKGNNPLIISWYKHSSRGCTINLIPTRKAWWVILRACMDSILDSRSSASR
jgi:hypothetical protein